MILGPVAFRIRLVIRRKFSQEVRLTSQLDSSWKYIAGLYYEKASLEQVYWQYMVGQ